MIKQIYEQNLLSGKKNVKTLVFLPQTGPEGHKLARQMTKEYEHGAMLSLLRKHDLDLLASLLRKKESGVLFVSGDTCTNVSWLYQYLTDAVSLSMERTTSDDGDSFGEVRVVTHELAAKGYHYCVRNSAYVEMKAKQTLSDGDGGRDGATTAPPNKGVPQKCDFSEEMDEEGDAESLDTLLSHSSDESMIHLLLQKECVLSPTHTQLVRARQPSSLTRSTNVFFAPVGKASSPQTLWLVPYFLSRCDSFHSLVHLWKVPPQYGRVQFLLFLNTDIVDAVLFNLPMEHGNPSLVSSAADDPCKGGESLSDEESLCAQDFITRTSMKLFLPLGSPFHMSKREPSAYSMASRRQASTSYEDFRRCVESFLSSSCCAHRRRPSVLENGGDAAGEGRSHAPSDRDRWKASSPKLVEPLPISVPTLALFSRAGIPADTADFFGRVESGLDSFNTGAFFSSRSTVNDRAVSGEMSTVLDRAEHLHKEAEGGERVLPSGTRAAPGDGNRSAVFHPALVATKADVHRLELSHYLQNRSVARTLEQMRLLKLEQQEARDNADTTTAGTPALGEKSSSKPLPTPRLYAPHLFSVGTLLSQDACVSDVYVLEFSPLLFQDLRVAYESQSSSPGWPLTTGCRQVRILSSSNTALENLRVALEALQLSDQTLLRNGCFASFQALCQSPSFLARREALRHIRTLLVSMCPTRRAFVWDMADDTVGCETRFAFCLSYEHFLDRAHRERLRPTMDPTVMRSRLDDSTSVEYALFHILFAFKEMGWFLIHQEDPTKWDKTEQMLVRKTSDVLDTVNTANTPALLSSIKQMLAEEVTSSASHPLMPSSSISNSAKKPYLYTDARCRRNSTTMWGAAVISREDSQLLWEGVPVLLDSGEFGVIVDFRPVPAFLRDAKARAEAGASLRGAATPLYPTTSCASDEVLDDVFIPFQDWWLSERGRLRPSAAVPPHLCDAEQTHFPVVRLRGSNVEVLVLPTRVTELDVRYPTLCYVSSFEQQLQHHKLIGDDIVQRESGNATTPFPELLYRPSLFKLAETPYGTQLRFVRLPLQTHYAETAASLFFAKAFFGDAFALYERHLQTLARGPLQLHSAGAPAHANWNESFARHFAALAQQSPTAWRTPKRKGTALFPIQRRELFHSWYALHHYRRPHIVHDNAVFSLLGEDSVSKSPWRTMRDLHAGSFHSHPRMLRCALASVPSLKSIVVKGCLPWMAMRASG